MTPAEWAAAYAAGGALVLPLHTPTTSGCSCRTPDCPHPGKHPRTLRGKDDATADVDQVSRWWSMWPAANIGIRPAAGQIVLDVDPRNGGGEQLAAMQARFGDLPATRTAVTGSGGLHLWFRLTGDVIGQLAPGLDIKSHGGYVVAPPSVHACGGIYTWSNDGPIVEAPGYLATMVRRPPRAARTGQVGQVVTPAVVEGLVRVVRTAPPGRRNDMLNWAAFRAAQRGIDPALLIEAAVGNGLSRREAERTVDSAVAAAGRA